LTIKAADTMVGDDVVEVVGAGVVRHYYRGRVCLDCPVDLHRFPFDSQQLAIRIRVPRHRLQGVNSVRADGFTRDPQLAAHCSPGEFVLRPDAATMAIRYAGDPVESTPLGKSASDGGALNRKPEVLIVLVADRQPTYLLTMIGLPNLCCSLVGLDAFVMDPASHADRMGIIVTLILTVVAFKMSVSERLPAIPYATLFDRWLLSLFFIFVLAAMESTAVYLLATVGGAPGLARRVDVSAFVGSLTFITVSSIAALGTARWSTPLFLGCSVAAAAAADSVFVSSSFYHDTYSRAEPLSSLKYR
jgi:hypothetical protein